MIKTEEEEEEEEEETTVPDCPSPSPSQQTLAQDDTVVNENQQEIGLNRPLPGPNAGFFLHFDKKLSDCVKRFPCLYDTKTVGYKDKNVAAQCWEMVSKDVEVESGEQAQKLYFNLKKRFHKRRNILKRLTRSGSTNQFALKKAKRDVQMYSFLNWLIPFTQIRQPRTLLKSDEIKTENMTDRAAADDDEFDGDIERPSFLSAGDLKADFQTQMHNGEDAQQHHHHSMATGIIEDSNSYDMNSNELDMVDEDIVTVTPQSPVSEQRPDFSPPTSSVLAEATPPLIIPAYTISIPATQRAASHSQNNSVTNSNSALRKSIPVMRIGRKNSNTRLPIVNKVRTFHNSSNKLVTNSTKTLDSQTIRSLHSSHACKANNYETDEDTLFGLMIAAELKNFPRQERCIAKHQIQNIVFEMQMSLIKDGKIISRNENNNATGTLK